MRGASPWNDAWTRDFAQPIIYDARDWIRNNTAANLGPEKRMMAALGQNGLVDVDFGGRSPYSGPITDDDLMPPDGAMSYLQVLLRHSVFSATFRPVSVVAELNINLTGPPPPRPVLKVSQYHGSWAWQDNAAMLPALVLYKNRLTPGSPASTLLRRSYSTPYQHPTAGDYTIQFKYYAPTCGIDPDGHIPTSEQTRTVTVPDNGLYPVPTAGPPQAPRTTPQQLDPGIRNNRPGGVQGPPQGAPVRGRNN